jgi:hypothetical protein
MDGTVKFHKVSSWESCLMGWFMNIYEYLGHVWPTAGPASWHEIPFCATRATCLQDARCSFNIILGMRNSLRLPSGWKLRIAGDRSKLWGRLPHSHRCTQWYTMCERRFSLSSEWKDWKDTNLASRARASCTAGNGPGGLMVQTAVVFTNCWGLCRHVDALQSSYGFACTVLKNLKMQGQNQVPHWAINRSTHTSRWATVK